VTRRTESRVLAGIALMAPLALMALAALRPGTATGAEPVARAHKPRAHQAQPAARPAVRAGAGRPADGTASRPPRRAAAVAANPVQSPASARQAEADLKALRDRIAAISAQVNHDALERDRLGRTLRDAEVAVGSARRGLEAIASEVDDRVGRRARLANERANAEATLEREREALAGQLRVAYRNGPDETLRLLLAGESPADGQRLLGWYGYFSRARAQQLARIDAQIAHIGELDASLAAEQVALEQLRAGRQKQLGALEQGRAARQAALQTLKQESESRSAQLARLRSQQADLERLLRELARAARPAAPAGTPDNSTAFGRLRGQLAWPAAGRIVARFGEQRATGVNWDGIVVGAERGSPVRAVAAGRVLYADWLPGLGLLAIIDHGEGYFSLYGYNEQLRRAAGDPVAAGDVIGAVGDTGGRPEPQLYFELRRSGKPLNPAPWFRDKAP
jgi:septal ring factor EnvC (AmiA/AmiB activator)